jgi:hypothetical protein
MNTGTWDSFYIEDSSTTYLDGVSFPNGLVVSFTVLPSLGGLLIPPEQTMFLDQRADFSSLDVSLVSSPPQILYQLDTYYLTRSSDTGPSIVDITSVDSASDAPQTDGSSNVTAGDTPQKESASQNSGSQTINSTTRSRASGADTTKPATPPSSSSRPTDAGSDPSGKSLGGGAIAGGYQTHYQEMFGVSTRQELEPTHSNKYPIPGSHELKVDARPSELPHYTT